MAMTNEAHATPLDRAGEGRGGGWTGIWSPRAMSRAAGLCALACLAISLVPTGSDFHSTMSAGAVVRWTGENQQMIWTDGFLTGLSNTFLALLLVLLAELTGYAGMLGRIARVGAAAAMTTGWIKAGVEFGLADLAHRGGADAGVLALFSLSRTMDYTDGVPIAVALGALTILLLRSRLLPRPVVWLSALAAVELIVVFPIQVAVTGTGNGIQGPISVVLGLLWLAVIGLTLLVRPAAPATAPSP